MLNCSQSCMQAVEGTLLYSSGSVAGKFSPAAAVILCLSICGVPSCVQAAEDSHSIVLTAALCRAVEQDAV